MEKRARKRPEASGPWLPPERHRYEMEPKPAKYAIVKQSIKQQIQDGTLAVDEKLPTEAEYAEMIEKLKANL